MMYKKYDQSRILPEFRNEIHKVKMFHDVGKLKPINFKKAEIKRIGDSYVLRIFGNSPNDIYNYPFNFGASIQTNQKEDILVRIILKNHKFWSNNIESNTLAIKMSGKSFLFVREMRKPARYLNKVNFKEM